jgi:uncharacterized membrane protein
MADLNQAKNIGGVGAILTILSVVPSVGPLLSIVGLVLVLLALKWISEIVQNPAIFRNALIAVVVAIVGVAIGAVVGGVGVFSVLTGVGAGGPNGIDFARLFTTIIIIALVVVWLFAVVSAVFFRRSLNLTGDHLNVKMFRTAGLLVLIGAVLTIVIVGAVISLVANILLAVAFFQIRASPPPPPPPPPSS